MPQNAAACILFAGGRRRLLCERADMQRGDVPRTRRLTATITREEVARRRVMLTRARRSGGLLLSHQRHGAQPRPGLREALARPAWGGRDRCTHGQQAGGPAQARRRLPAGSRKRGRPVVPACARALQCGHLRRAGGASRLRPVRAATGRPRGLGCQRGTGTSSEPARRPGPDVGEARLD